MSDSSSDSLGVDKWDLDWFPSSTSAGSSNGQSSSSTAGPSKPKKKKISFKYPLPKKFRSTPTYASSKATQTPSTSSDEPLKSILKKSGPDAKHQQHVEARSNISPKLSTMMGQGFKLKVMKLPPYLDEDDVADIFEEFGEILAVTLFRDEHKKSPSTADIVFKHETCADLCYAAIRCHQSINGLNNLQAFKILKKNKNGE